MDWEERFWSRIDKSGGEDSCWIWQKRGKDEDIAFTIDGKIFSAHRLIWEITYGGLSCEQWIKHCSKTNLCMNPAHFSLGQPYGLSNDDLFWLKTDRSGGDDVCWLWTNEGKHEVITFDIEGKSFSAHRFAWETRYGKLPEGQRIKHCPKTNRCMNPKHFSLGQRRDLSDEERFWSKVDKSRGPDACWPWTEGLFSTGYGQFSLGRKSVRSNKQAWELTNGKVPDGLLVLNSCGNKICCNPKHWFLGQLQDSNFWRSIGEFRASMTDEEKEDFIKTSNDKTKQTWLAKYGVDHPSRVPSIIDKAIQTKRENGSFAIATEKGMITRKERYGRYSNYFPCFSLESQELFAGIEERLPGGITCLYATNGSTSFSNEYQIFYGGSSPIHYLDFYVPEFGRWIEFDEEYHQQDDVAENDIRREKSVLGWLKNTGLMRVDKQDYLTDKEKVIKDCCWFVLSGSHPKAEQIVY